MTLDGKLLEVYLSMKDSSQLSLRTNQSNVMNLSKLKQVMSSRFYYRNENND